jgi:type I restriction enzyme S subunit
MHKAKNTADLQPGWKVWRFEQIATNVNTRIENPSESGMEHYVGLEHLDTDSLKIRRWGSPDDVEATKLMFKKGDIIFGRRRAYQRKLGVAEFDGICSAHAMVLRAKSEVVHPEFLPFFMQSDLFMNRAIEISVGSLSPTINWKTMAVQEFALPSLAEQVRLIELMESFDDLLDSYSNLWESARQTVASSTNSLFTVQTDLSAAISRFSNTSEIDLPKGWSLSRASDICSVQVTSGSTPREGIVDTDTGCPFLRVQNLTFDGRLDLSSSKFLDEFAFRSTVKTHVQPGDVLTNIVGPPLGKVSLIPENFPESQINQAIVRFRPKHVMLGKYLAYYLMSEFAKSWLFSRSKKTSGQRNINSSTCAALPVPMPPSERVEDIARQMDGLFGILKDIEQRRSKILHMKMRLLNNAPRD